MKNIIYTVTQINNTLNFYLSKNHQDVWINGNISNLKSYSSGHTYFTLKDENSEIQCVLFNTYSQSLNNELKNNSNVTLFGDLSMYVNKGQFQLIVKNAYQKGESKLWVDFNKIKNKMLNEGKFDDTHKKKIPSLPSRIAILASKKSAALQDFLNILKRRAPFISIDIYNILSQGNLSVNSIIENLKKVDKSSYDLVVLTRGGGSIEDLHSFNNELLANVIFNLNTPIITAIGHKTDVSLVDYVSDKTASTPSEAAEICALSIVEIKNLLDFHMLSINEKIQTFLFILKNRITSYKDIIETMKPELIVENITNRLNVYNAKLKSSINDRIVYLNNRTEIYDKVLENINLIHKRKKGFSITKKNNKVVSRINQISKNDILTTDLYDGFITSKVIAKNKYE